MPTILELFKGSTMDKAVKADKDTVIEQEFSGIRPHSAVELNNPLLYGNEAIRIATRSTSSVEKMKQSTGGTAGDGGLIGKGLGAITGGKFGKFLFGGKVTSLNQARDGVNTRLGIPSNAIPTYVYNTQGLQKGIEPDTMITIGKIKNDATGTLLGQFLKKTGGGTPQTIGKQLLGQGISLGKDKLRTALFGNVNSIGSNSATASQIWEYSSNLPYSKQISNIKFNTKTISGIEASASTNITKKITQLQLDAKKKLGEASTNATNALKANLKSGNTKSAIDETLDKAKKANEKELKPSSETPYSTTLGDYKNEGGADKLTRIDLSLVSPVYGVDRKKTKGKYGTSEYAFQDVKNNTGIYSPYNPTSGYEKTNKANWDSVYGLKNGSDKITQSNSSKGGANPNLEKMDLIPIWFKSKRTSETTHFRAYISGLTETTSPEWTTNKFVGNPYNFYTYEGVQRGIQFNLQVISLNSVELSKNWEKLEFLTSETYPSFTKVGTGRTYTQPPIISFRLGDMYVDKVGYIESLTYTIDENTPWETNRDGALLPKFINVAISIKFIEAAGDEGTLYNFERNKDAIKIINQKNSNGGNFQTDRIEKDKNETITPPKVDNKGVPTKPTKEGKINKPPKNTKGKTETPPKQEESGKLDYSDNAISEWFRVSEENTKKLINKGVPENVASFIGKQENVDLNSVVKLNETTWYFERPKLGGFGTYQGTYNSKNFMSYTYWGWVVDYNKGVNVLNKTVK